MKIRQRWQFLISLAIPVLLMQGCAFAPGLQLKAGPGFFTFSRLTEPVEEDDYILVPVTKQVVQRLELEHLKAESLTAESKIPAEWIVDSQNYDYQVGFPDNLQIVVLGHPELNIAATTSDSRGATETNGAAGTEGAEGISVRVSSDGTILLPVVGAITVAGKSINEIKKLVTRALRPYIRDPLIDVMVTSFRSKKVQVVGEVKEPKDVAITDVPLRLVDVINAAGGPGPSAALDNVQVFRQGRQIRLSLLHIYDLARSEENILLQDGDVVNVKNSENVFIMGEVKSSGLKPLESRGLTLLTALQSSGGLNQDSANAAKVIVLRQGKDKPLVYYLNANEPEQLLLSTRFPLQQSDIVYVFTSEIRNFGKIISTIMMPAQYGMSAATIMK
ncbi:MAG: polysaccharide biosynthesis/export family protein [Methylobacter sp.]